MSCDAGIPSMVTVGAVGTSCALAQAASSAAVVPLPSNVLHSHVCAMTKTLVPALTVQ
jgi:hypothetical protein